MSILPTEMKGTGIPEFEPKRLEKLTPLDALLYKIEKALEHWCVLASISHLT